MEPVARLPVKRNRPDPALFIGSGKCEQLAALAAEQQAQWVLFDQALSPAQARNLERTLGVQVLDRTDLIVRIFARRARSHEGKLQVELASCEHQLSRLKRAWSHLERQQGGVGVRGGPGEKQLELDRRMLETKIKRLKQQLQRVERQRGVRRKARLRSGVPTVALVGYTNAGKSTLFNQLTGAQTYAADQLFATLDPLLRRIRVGAAGEHQCILADTVGFIRDLPHTLVAAFRATLQETVSADLLLHVVDSTHPQRDQMIEDVEAVLGEIGAGDVPRILVMNKIDRGVHDAGIERDPYGKIRAVFTSAISGTGLTDLQRALGEVLFDQPGVEPALPEEKLLHAA